MERIVLLKDLKIWLDIDIKIILMSNKIL